MLSYIDWRCNEILMLTHQGLYLWTSSFHSLQHTFRPIKDNELWEWGF